MVFILDVNCDFGRIDVELTSLNWCYFLFMVFQFVDILGECRFQCGVVVMFSRHILVDEL
jgi:hypothetical protein